MAILYFQSLESKWLQQKWVVKIGDVDVVSHKIGNAPKVENKQRILVSAYIKLPGWPEKTLDNCIIVPETERKSAEEAIESVANLIAIAERCQRSISSPSPCVAFLPENNKALEWLEASAGIVANRDVIPDARFRLDIDEKLLTVLSDRLDGVTLLSEALAHSHATGKYHEFIRLYERAFQLSISQLDKKLSKFLNGAELGYEREEIKNWLQLRDAATHADEKKSHHLVLESDVTRFIPRMEQAAYDLLLNKTVWRDPSSERRNVWKPVVATVSRQDDIRSTKGQSGSFQFQAFDEFKSYPLDLNGFLNSLPDNAWSKWAS